MLNRTYLRNSIRAARSPLSMRLMADGSYLIVHTVTGDTWERGDAASTLSTYKELRRNYLAMFRDDTPTTV